MWIEWKLVLARGGMRIRKLAEIIIAYSHSVDSPMRIFDDLEKDQLWLNEPFEE
jgi:hypothetical protein